MTMMMVLLLLLMLFQTAETPLHIAARVDDGEKCAEMLIKSGADSNASQQVRCTVVFGLHHHYPRHFTAKNETIISHYLSYNAKQAGVSFL